MDTVTVEHYFLSTGRTWLVLLATLLLWLGTFLWAIQSIGFVEHVSPSTEVVALQHHAINDPEQFRLTSELERDVERDKQEHLRLEAEEERRLQMQLAAADRRERATAEAAEKVRLAALEWDLRAVERKARERAQREAERLTAEQATLATQRQADEQRWRAGERRTAELARISVQRQVDEQARRSAERGSEALAQAEAQAEARAEAEAEAEEQEQEQEQARTQALQAAKAEAARVAALARQMRAYERRRAAELQPVQDSTATIRFERGASRITQDIARNLDQILKPLNLYAQLPIKVAVAANEYEGVSQDAALSSDRGQAIAAYLISRGLSRERFRILIETGEGLDFGTHRIGILLEENP